MGIKFPVGVGTILLCDYSRGGFQPPEMVKKRPAIVVSPRLPHRNALCGVVPISGEPNAHATSYEIKLKFAPPLPYPFSYEFGWAKCDMVATVSFERLDLFHTDRDQYGKRKYLHPKLSKRLTPLSLKTRKGDPAKARAIDSNVVIRPLKSLRSDLKINVAPQWTLALRGDLPFVDRNPITADNPLGEFIDGLGDADVQAATSAACNWHRL